LGDLILDLTLLFIPRRAPRGRVNSFSGKQRASADLFAIFHGRFFVEAARSALVPLRLRRLRSVLDVLNRFRDAVRRINHDGSPTGCRRFSATLFFGEANGAKDGIEYGWRDRDGRQNFRGIDKESASAIFGVLHANLPIFNWFSSNVAWSERFLNKNLSKD
jgi:hypothetical protein